MRLHIDCIAAAPEWKGYVPALRPMARKACRAALLALPLPWENLACTIEIAISLGNDDTIRDLNDTYRGKDKPTNVLSFPQREGMLESYRDELRDALFWPLGDIAVSATTIEREARQQGKTFENHLAHLLVHSTLHLAGYDHIGGQEARIMEAMEINILKKLGIGNPYL